MCTVVQINLQRFIENRFKDIHISKESFKNDGLLGLSLICIPSNEYVHSFETPENLSMEKF